MSDDTEQKHEEEVDELKKWYHTVNALRIGSIAVSALVVLYDARTDDSTVLLHQYLFAVVAVPIFLCLFYSAMIQWGHHYDMYWMSAAMGPIEAGFSLYHVVLWISDNQLHHTGLQLVALGAYAICTILFAPTSAEVAGHLYRLCKTHQEGKKSR
jgi:hypothetical protein